MIEESSIEFEHEVEDQEEVVEKFKDFLEEVTPRGLRGRRRAAALARWPTDQSPPPTFGLDDLLLSPTAALFEGESGGAGITMFVTRTPPGKFVELHTHPYPETFVLLEGTRPLDQRRARGRARAELGDRGPARHAARLPQHRRRPLLVVSVHESATLDQTFTDREPA